MTPLAIIKQVFQDRNFTDVTDLTSGAYPTLEYTVQYRETDLNFVLRLMEEYGIFYYFSFATGDGMSPSDHNLVLADSSTHVALPNPTTVTYRPTDTSDRADDQQFSDWSKTSSVVTGVFSLNDYNYESHGTNLLATTTRSYTFAHSDMELYNYPGTQTTQSDGEQLTGVLADADHSRSQTWSASGYAPSLTPGYKITRASANTDSNSDDGDYLILRCSHSFGEQNYDSNSTAGVGYGGIYELGEGSETYRMPAVTRKPIIAGTQPALVVGQEGEEIDVDSLGRILVQFYWDRKKSPSRRVRVAQFWAGTQRGALFTPRIGDEVRIGYEEGDPDRPLVVGSVYNNENAVPMKLPGQKNNSGILTKSTKNSDGYSFLLFNDTAGSEVVKIRAQKDLRFKALNNELRDIGGSQAENIGGDETITVGGPSGGGHWTVEAAKEIHLSVSHGSSDVDMTPTSITASVAKSSTLYMDATTISLSVGASSFVMTPSSITMESPQITETGDATVSISAPMVSVNGG
jgi:type VI secretion system secreted protein VgrG